MELHEAETLALLTMARHGLTDAGWTFRWLTGSSTTLGRCCYAEKTLELQRANALTAERAEIEQIMLHEVAHALVGPDVGHGWRWLAIARRIGYTGWQHGERASTRVPRDELAVEHGLVPLTRRPSPGKTVWYETGGDFVRGLVISTSRDRYTVRATTGEHLTFPLWKMYGEAAAAAAAY